MDIRRVYLSKNGLEWGHAKLWRRGALTEAEETSKGVAGRAFLTARASGPGDREARV